MTLTVPLRKSIQQSPEDSASCEWSIFEDGRLFSCDIAIVRERAGYSALAVNLPGVVSCGDSIDDAIKNVRDALSAALAVYVEDGQIPWSDDTQIDGDVVCEKRIVVNV